ncbi:centrosomin-like isoform X2 [Thrips palmi]|uniref:Centrosomin-like isoform X2 n=1 Tax=Thrips palmi TaxID=161013 RepID=A0A6P8ZHC8_THRPL|nr:centrosomin-like isoform X2 [Thrips palmi]
MSEFDETGMSMLFDETNTSPSQLDAALGQTFNEAFAQPTTSKASPIRGRTMKDYEEKQSALRKENFNLKLRIYFLEERMSQINGLKDKEEAIKNNIELNVENETMRKELSEKQELLCQAAKALDLLEDQRKDEKQRYLKECSVLESKIQELEKELQDSIAASQQMKFSAMTQSTDSQYSSACFEVDQLTAQIQELQEQSQKEREKICLLETELRDTKQQSEMLNITVKSQNDIILKMEEVVGVKQSDLANRVQKLLDAEKLVSELKVCLSANEETMQEREVRHSKVKAYNATLTAKLNTANLELQRLREEVKSLKRQRNEEMRRRPSGCTDCMNIAAANQDLQDKLLEKEKESKDHEESAFRKASMIHQLLSDVAKLTKEKQSQEAQICELTQKLSALCEDKNAVNKPNAEFHEDRECRLQSIEASLREKESQLVACEQRLEARDNRIQELELEIQALRKEHFQMTGKNPQLNVENAAQENLCNISSHESILKQLTDKDKEIENLNMELKKRTFNLQELVNKELWDKNKQIERLELRLAAQGAVCESKEGDLKEAKRKLAEFGVTVTSLGPNSSEINTDDVSELQEQLKISLEEQKYLSREVDSLKERLRNTPERDSESRKLQRLLIDNKRLQETEEHHRMWRREASKALSVLRTRLEELAIFLDELLHQPALVVGLCADRQRVLRAAINGSLELSRTIANLSSESVPEGSCSPCPENDVSLCSYSHEDAEISFNPVELGLKGGAYYTICDSEHRWKAKKDSQNSSFFLTTDNIDKDQQISGASVRTRRRSRSHPQGTSHSKVKGTAANQNAGSQSDSEAWSEPDRSVSQARMGIHNESSRTVSSVASTVRRVSLGGQSSSSESQNGQLKTCPSLKEAANADDNKLSARTHCLEKLNQALEVQIGLPSSKLSENPHGENSNCESAVGPIKLWERLDWEKNARKAWQKCAASRLHQLQVLSRANSALSEKVILQDNLQKERQSQLLNMKLELVENSQNAVDRESITAHTMRGLEEKVQELSVQVLEVEVRREQAELDAQQAIQEKDRLEKDLSCKLAAAQKESEQARQEAASLQVTVKQLLSKKYELEKEAKLWKERAQELDRELEKWKRVVQKCEIEIKETHSQLAHKFKEKLVVLEQLKNVAEQKTEEWISKYKDLEAKSLEIDRRAKDKVHLLEEQLKLKHAEIERRSEELQEKLKREAEIKASRKLEKIVEQRMKEYDADSRAAAVKRVRDVETAFISRISELERKAADANIDAEKRVLEVEDKYKIKEKELIERISEAERHSKGGGEIQQQLNDAAVATSQAQLETARLANEKLQLEQQIRWLQSEAKRDRKQLQDQLGQKILSLTQANGELQKHVRDLEREVHSNQYQRRKGGSSGSGSATSEGKVLTEITNLKHCNADLSDYVSEQEEHVYPLQESGRHGWYDGEMAHCPPAVVLTAHGNTVSVGNGPGRVTSASPDLGIESDQGRFSSLEPFPLKKSTTAPALSSPDNLAVALQVRKKQQMDYKGLEQENQELKQRLLHTRQTLEQTYAQLAAANQRKRLVEKAICKQLHKTHHILRRARDNFETNPAEAPEPEEASMN